MGRRSSTRWSPGYTSTGWDHRSTGRRSPRRTRETADPFAGRLGTGPTGVLGALDEIPSTQRQAHNDQEACHPRGLVPEPTDVPVEERESAGKEKQTDREGGERRSCWFLRHAVPYRWAMASRGG